MRFVTILLLATTLFAKDPVILKFEVDTGSFTIAAKTTSYDTINSGRIDSTITIVWHGSVVFSAEDPDNDSMGVFIDVIVDNDTIPADSVWGTTRVAAGNDQRAFFSFHTIHPAWSGVATASVQLALDDVFTGFTGRPRITTQPENVSTLAGFKASFKVIATGTPLPAYQWFFNGTAIEDAVENELTFASVDSTRTGIYFATCSNGNGTIRSATATLTVNYAPLFTLQPMPDTVDTGKSVTFTALAVSYPAPVCQWRKNGVNIPGATATTFSIQSVGIADSGVYTAVMSNLVGNATSDTAVLTVNYAPRITVQPADKTARIGQCGLFEAVAQGRPLPSYQWLKDGVPVPGDTFAAISISPARAGDAGSYTVMATNRIGSSMSSGATLTVSTAVLKTDSMIVFPGGTFLMGKLFLSDPVHPVTLSAFKMSNTLVTQAEYARVTGISPAFFKGDSTLPIENVTWFDAVLYCNEKSKLEKMDTVYRYDSIIGTPFDGCEDLPGVVIDYSRNGYRLPTEAEYEYVCRAGTGSDYYWGRSYPPQTHEDTAAIDCYAVWFHNSEAASQPVGIKQPNPWGLYDIVGQTWHWLNDWYGAYADGPQTDPEGPETGFSRTVRGGSWSDLDDDQHLRSMARNGGYFPNDRSAIIGFRVVTR